MLILIDDRSLSSRMSINHSLFRTWLPWLVLISGTLSLLLLLVLDTTNNNSNDILDGANKKKSIQKDGKWAKRFDKYYEQLNCLAIIFEQSIPKMDRSEETYCCRYEAFNSWLMDQTLAQCPKQDPDEILSLVHHYLLPYFHRKCAQVDTNTFSCQMMKFMMSS